MRLQSRRRRSGGERHPVDEILRPDRLGVLGLQHVLVMYAGCVTVPLVVGPALHLDTRTIGFLVNADLFTAGIATIVQTVGIGRLAGVRAPVVCGASFVPVSPMILIGSKDGLPAMYGAIIVAGVAGVFLARPFGRILRLFPPLVTGTVITIIGLSLISAAVDLIAGSSSTAKGYAAPRDIALAAGVIVFVLLVSRFVRGFFNQVAVLLGLIAGTLVAIPMNLVHFASVGQASVFGLTSPLRFGAPKFEAAAIISMVIVMLVTFTESTADMLAVGEMVDKEMTPPEIARGLTTDALSAILGGFMNAFIDTTFAQNVGLVGITKVRSRYVVTTAGVILVALGILPKVGQVVANVPGPVVGGVGLVMFGMVTAVGIRTLAPVRFTGTNNLLIVATALAVGMTPVVAPDFYEHFPSNFQIIFGSSITSTSIVVFALNILFNELGSRAGPDGALTGSPTGAAAEASAEAAGSFPDAGRID